MIIIGKKILYEHCTKHTDCRKWIENWISDAENSKWDTPHSVKGRYSSISFLEDNQAIFNVKGNAYRLVTRIAYNTQVIFVLWVGTHADYSKMY